MKRRDQLLDQFIQSSIQVSDVVEERGDSVYLSPHVQEAIHTARKVLPLLDDRTARNRVVGIVHDLYKELRTDIKKRGTRINGQKHPALDVSQQAYRIIIS